MGKIDTIEYLKAIPNIPKRDWGKVIEVKCPCGGKLKATKAIDNGHIHARCESCHFLLRE